MLLKSDTSIVMSDYMKESETWLTGRSCRRVNALRRSRVLPRARGPAGLARPGDSVLKFTITPISVSHDGGAARKAAK